MTGGTHGTKAKLFMDDSEGVCVNISGTVTSITLNRTKNNPETTTLGDVSVARIDGLEDGAFDFTALYESSASSARHELDMMYAGSDYRRIQLSPASETGSPVYTACMFLGALTINVPADGLTTITGTFELGAGCVVAACIA